tara:strand:+ start:538 stop:1344 length:807 start_codon:yes stop_codon:yes gene_type:complete
MKFSPEKLNLIDNEIRKKIIEMIFYSKSGHVGPSLSIVEILTNIYLNYVDFDDPDRNKVILSKGHAAPTLYAIYDYLNLLEKDEYKTLRKIGSRLQGHPDKRKLDLIDAGTGALGQGLSISIGYALAFKSKNLDRKVFCIIGDGETQEGQIWEAAMYIGTYKLNNIITFLDSNKFQNEYSVKETLPVQNMISKWQSFGFAVEEINGHDNNAISNVLEKFKNNFYKNPPLIYCNTIKGKGIKEMENNNKFHHIKDLNEKDFLRYIEELN